MLTGRANHFIFLSAQLLSNRNRLAKRQEADLTFPFAL